MHRWCVNACGVSVYYVRVYMCVPSSACLSTTAVSLLKFAIGDNLQIDQNLDDKAATASIVNSCVDMHGHSMIKLDLAKPKTDLYQSN